MQKTDIRPGKLIWTLQTGGFFYTSSCYKSFTPTAIAKNLWRKKSRNFRANRKTKVASRIDKISTCTCQNSIEPELSNIAQHELSMQEKQYHQK